jgi:hypothetical protein
MKPWEEFANAMEESQRQVDEERRGLRWAFTNWIAEGQRLRTLAPLDFAEAIADLHDDIPTSFRASVHRYSA